MRTRLELFRERLLEGAREAEQRFPHLDAHEFARFAVTDLLPNRVFAASLFIAPITEADAEHIDDFLATIELGAIGQIAAANDADDVADAVIRAAEDLHSYLLGHDIVDDRYRHLTAGSLFRQGERLPGTSSLASWVAYGSETSESSEVTATDSHEYALAA